MSIRTRGLDTPSRSTAPERMTASCVGQPSARIISPADLPDPSGGTIYNERIAAQWGVEIEWLPGSWPFPSPEDLRLLEAALMPSGQARPEPILLDGAIGCAAPEVVYSARAAGARVVLVVHLPLPAETGLSAREIDQLRTSEAMALREASAIVATSRWAAADLYRRYDIERIDVAEPGTDPAPLALGSTPPRFVTVAAYNPRKNHRLLIETFAVLAVRDMAWTALWVGADPTGDAKNTTERAVVAAGLGTRISVQGPAHGSDMAAIWAGADVLLLPSRAETYAMVVAEALACGLPALVGSDTGAAETLRGQDTAGPMPGLALPTDDPSAWAEAIHTWLTSAPVRQAWSDSAYQRRSTLGSWHRSAEIIGRVMNRSTQ